MFATPVNAPSPKIEMRISHLFKWANKLDHLLCRIGLPLPIRFMAWVTGRSVQVRINGRWKTIHMSTDEVMHHAFG